ncbi:Holliday junction resolvase RuvX [Candidatus Peregrinibacteria bacterium]|nr:Holliday junction resolvase RuvX [Candidatus Peregrinibacteria bacterium]
MTIKRILALDYGTKRIGLAIGDTENRIASPHGIIENRGLEFVILRILEFCEDWGIKKIILGLPLNMDDSSDNEMMTIVRHFLSKLRDKIKREDKDISVELFDERLTSFEAKKLISEYPDAYKHPRARKDEISAQILLSRFFDKQA